MIAAKCVKKGFNSSHYFKINMIRFAGRCTSGIIQKFRLKQPKGGRAVYDTVRSTVIAVIPGVRQKKLRESWCYGVNCVPPNSYAEDLTPQCGNIQRRGLGEVIRFR